MKYHHHQVGNPKVLWLLICAIFVALPFGLLLLLRSPPIPAAERPLTAAAIAATRSGDHGGKGSLSVLTYNIWNQMFHWPVRKLKIAQTISTLRPDLVALQEVLEFGGTQEEGQPSNQMLQLQALLPDYPHGSFMLSARNKIPAEGLAILSRHPIVSTTQIPLPQPATSPDKNPRQLLKARVHVPGLGLLDFYVTHMTYDRNLQCHHAHEILKAISRESKGIDAWVIAGDLNIYHDHEDPVGILEGASLASGGRYPNCVPPDEIIPHTDVWKAVHSTAPGLTFSNMPTPGLESRPDRILYHGAPLQPVRTFTLSGKEYQEEYYLPILKDRALTMMKNEQCPFDCGPRGHCQCGVCVFGPGEPCEVPCPACQETKDHVPKILGLCALLLVISLIFSCYGFRRRRWWARLGNFLLAIGVSCAGVFFWIRATFPQEIDILFNYLPEEFNPSDHHALYAEFIIR